MALTQLVPIQDRQWLVEFRRLKGHTIHGVANACELSHITYLNIESGRHRQSTLDMKGQGKKISCTVKTVSVIANVLGIKLDMFYYPTDSEGRLTAKSCIVDVLTLFSSQGYKSAVYRDVMITAIFSPELAEYIIENILSTVI